jgi:hypothetical protein
VDAGDYPEDDDCNDNAKPTPEEAKESGPIYPCTALAVFKILESFRSSLSAGGGRISIANAGSHWRRQRRPAQPTSRGRNDDDNQPIGGPWAPCHDAVEDGGCNSVLR